MKNQKKGKPAHPPVLPTHVDLATLYQLKHVNSEVGRLEAELRLAQLQIKQKVEALNQAEHERSTVVIAARSKFQFESDDIVDPISGEITRVPKTAANGVEGKPVTS